MKSWDEIRDQHHADEIAERERLLGEAVDQVVADVPPLTPQQEARLSVMLRRPADDEQGPSHGNPQIDEAAIRVRRALREYLMSLDAGIDADARPMEDAAAAYGNAIADHLKALARQQQSGPNSN